MGNLNQFLTKIFVVFFKHFSIGCGNVALQYSLDALHLRFDLIAVHGNAEKRLEGAKSPLERVKSDGDSFQQFVLEGSVDETTNGAVLISNLAFELHGEGSGIGDFVHILTTTSEGDVSTVVGQGDTVVNDGARTSEVESTHGKESKSEEQRWSL